jgi:hypothetical protein
VLLLLLASHLVLQLLAGHLLLLLADGFPALLPLLGRFAVVFLYLLMEVPSLCLLRDELPCCFSYLYFIWVLALYMQVLGTFMILAFLCPRCLLRVRVVAVGCRT